MGEERGEEMGEQWHHHTHKMKQTNEPTHQNKESS